MSTVPNLIRGMQQLIAQAKAGPVFGAREWLFDRNIQLYARVGRKHIDGVVRGVLMLASFEVPPEHHRTGRMRAMFEAAEALVQAEPVLYGILVESVLTTEIVPFLLERGYVHEPGTDPFGEGMGNYIRTINQQAALPAKFV